MNGSPLETRSGPRLAARSRSSSAAGRLQRANPALLYRRRPGQLCRHGRRRQRRRQALGDYLAGSYALDTGFRSGCRLSRARARGGPRNPDLLVQVYLLTLAGGRYDQALELAERLIEVEPGDEEAQLLLALDEARNGRFGPAHGAMEAIDNEGIAGLAAPFLDAWAIFGEGGENPRKEASQAG